MIDITRCLYDGGDNRKFVFLKASLSEFSFAQISAVPKIQRFNLLGLALFSLPSMDLQ